MNLSDTRFFKSTLNFRRCANCPMESVPMYSYESTHSIYDVIVMADGTTNYRVNGGGNSRCSAYHIAIMQKYGVERKDVL